MLPYGYTVSLLLAIIPPIWFKVIDPIAEATNKNEKVSEEFKKMQERWVLSTLCGTSLLISYICFFVIGFK